MTYVPVYQNFYTDYTLEQPASTMAVAEGTPYKITMTDTPIQQVDHWLVNTTQFTTELTGSFEINFTINFSALPADYSIAFMLTTEVDDRKYLVDNHKPYIAAIFSRAVDTLSVILREGFTTDPYYSDATVYQVAFGTKTYYCKLHRHESAGTLVTGEGDADSKPGRYGLLCLDLYSDAARQTIVNRQKVSLHEQHDFTYLMPVVGYTDAGAGTVTGYVENVEFIPQMFDFTVMRHVMLPDYDSDFSGYGV